MRKQEGTDLWANSCKSGTDQKMTKWSILSYLRVYLILLHLPDEKKEELSKHSPNVPALTVKPLCLWLLTAIFFFPARCVKEIFWGERSRATNLLQNVCSIPPQGPSSRTCQIAWEEMPLAQTQQHLRKEKKGETKGSRGFAKGNKNDTG